MPRRLGKNPELYNIPAHFSFVDALAKGIMERFGDDILSLSEVLILLPNRRAVKSLRDAFLRLNDGKSTILPRIQPIGDVDEDGLVMGSGSFFDDLDLKPAVPDPVRQMLLMNIISSWYKERGEEVPESASCAELADALGHLLDQVQTEELGFSELENIVPDEYSVHWQQTLEFLKILTEYWPDILATTGYIDKAERRNKLIMGLRELWLNSPPQSPIIAAGSTGSIKATSALLQVIARLPKGMVVLPGVDVEIDDESWEAIEDSHPQATMKQLLNEVQADRVEVLDWLPSKDTGENTKTTLFREVMRPSKTTTKWRDLKWNKPSIMDGITEIVTPGIREEAGVIALMMREQLNIPGKTAALVTPDRLLVRQVQGELARWGIKIDDSAGTPLFNETPGIYLRLIAAMVGERFAPVPLLSALKNPLIAGGMEIGTFRQNVRQLEQKYLRGPRPAPGTDGIKNVIDKDDELYNWWNDLSEIIKPFEALANIKDISFSELLFAHISLAEKLCATDKSAGDKILWKGDAGEVAALFIEDVQQAAPYLKRIDAAQYPALFDQLMSKITVRAKYGQHPRLNIWGPLEARLQHADLMILSGLNEGVWPPEATPDPWMSRPMRKAYGLPDLEQKIGLSAHDFVQAASAQNVVLTRSEKQDGTPTVKSRWLSRLHALIGENKEKSDQWVNWYYELDKPKNIIEIAPPRPMPPVDARPRKLSVTNIQTWMQDPYSLYAKYILNLKPLDELDQNPGAADKGNIIHNALDEFMKKYKDHIPEDAEEKLIDMGRSAFGKVLDRPSIWAFWWPRFKQIASWFVEHEKTRRDKIKTVATEVQGETVITTTLENPFILRAKADRIDQFKDGSGYSIVDYKTGRAPTLRQMKAGFAAQLPLEALIAVSGNFTGLKKDNVFDLSYWKLSGGDKVAEVSSFNQQSKYKASRIDVMEETQKAREGLTRLVVRFEKEKTPYLSNPRPDQLGYGEYDHLARTKEWFGKGDDS